MTTHNKTTTTKTTTFIEEEANKCYNQGIDHSIKVCEAEIQRAARYSNPSAKEHIRSIILNLHKLKTK